MSTVTPLLDGRGLGQVVTSAWEGREAGPACLINFVSSAPPPPLTSQRFPFGQRLAILINVVYVSRQMI